MILQSCHSAKIQWLGKQGALVIPAAKSMDALQSWTLWKGGWTLEENNYRDPVWSLLKCLLETWQVLCSEIKLELFSLGAKWKPNTAITLRTPVKHVGGSIMLRECILFAGTRKIIADRNSGCESGTEEMSESRNYWGQSFGFAVLLCHN